MKTLLLWIAIIHGDVDVHENDICKCLCHVPPNKIYHAVACCNPCADCFVGLKSLQFAVAK